jgi:hypothetical protein
LVRGFFEGCDFHDQAQGVVCAGEDFDPIG